MEPVSTEVRTLADAERAHIVATLRETNWVVDGPSGAAARLGLPRTSLIARMQRLGLAKYPAAQGEKPRGSVNSEGHLARAASAGYGGTDRQPIYAG